MGREGRGLLSGGGAEEAGGVVVEDEAFLLVGEIGGVDAYSLHG